MKVVSETIEKIMKFLFTSLKRIVIIIFIALDLFVAYIFWPWRYQCKIYDLGDKYISCEFVAYSDSCRFVIVSKDGIHRAVVKDTFKGNGIDIYFQQCGTDTVFISGSSGKKNLLSNVVETNDIVLEHSTGNELIYDKDIMLLRWEHGGFNHLFTGKDLGTLKTRYRHIYISTEHDMDNPYPEVVNWIWPLQNPLIKQYPFGKEARKSGSYRVK